MERLRSDIWVAAYLRRAVAEGAYGVLRRRGAAEAGAIFVVASRHDGLAAVFAPSPADEANLGERRWFRAHSREWIDPVDVEARLAAELRVDPDIWIVELESRDGSNFLDLAPEK